MAIEIKQNQTAVVWIIDGIENGLNPVLKVNSGCRVLIVTDKNLSHILSEGKYNLKHIFNRGENIVGSYGVSMGEFSCDYGCGGIPIGKSKQTCGVSGTFSFKVVDPSKLVSQQFVASKGATVEDVRELVLGRIKTVAKSTVFRYIGDNNCKAFYGDQKRIMDDIHNDLIESNYLFELGLQLINITIENFCLSECDEEAEESKRAEPKFENNCITEEKVKCTNCGIIVSKSEKYCRHCGEIIK